MWGVKKRRIAELEDRIRRLVDERDDARGDAAGHLSAAKRTAARNGQLTELLELAREVQGNAEHERLTARLERALRACARYRAELAAQHRVVDRLTDQLFNSLGYEDAGLQVLGVAVHPLADTDVTP